MRKAFIIFLLLSFYINYGLSQSTDSLFQINGHITGLTKGTIYLKYYRDTVNFTDSSAINNGNFKFSGIIHIPTSVYVVLSNTIMAEQAAFFLEPANIKIELRNDPFSVIKESGSKSQDEAEEWKVGYRTLKRTFSNVFDNNIELLKDTAKKRRLEDSLELFTRQRTAMNNNFIKKYPQSYVIPYIMSSFYRDYSYKEFMTIYDSLNPAMQQSRSGKLILEFLNKLAAIAADTLAPDITAKDYIKNQNFSLSAQKGKYVMMDFWGSWCAPCIALLPAIVKEHQKYKGKNVVFVSVAYDFNVNQNKCKDIVNKNGMNWVNLWQSMDKQDPNGITVKYHTRQFPVLVLIDPKGHILINDDSPGAFLKCKKKLEQALTNQTL